jgi:hypothetical protein
MKEYKITGFVRLTDSHWKFIINHHLVDVRLYKTKNYYGIEHFPSEDRDLIKKIINTKILNYDKLH